MNKNEDINLKNWAEEEFSEFCCGDKRLDQRFLKIANELSGKPTSPINHACDDWAATKATYRFFDNDKIDEQCILTPHLNETAKRASKYPFVLAIQDTSVIDYTSHKKTKGLGQIGKHPSEKVNMQGIQFHPCLLLSPQGLPLGLASSQIWTRGEKIEKGKDDHKKIPIEYKESYRWVESFENTIETIGTDTKSLTICDRESDIFDLFLTAKDLGEHLLIRSSHDRSIYLEGGNRRLFSHMKDQKSIGNFLLDVPYKKAVFRKSARGKKTLISEGPNGENKRVAEVEVRISQVKILPPQTMGQIVKEKVGVTVIEAVEKHPPEGYEPVHWRLISTLAIENFEEACLMLKFYSFRWTIETYFKILKSGCSVEKTRLSTGERLKKHLALLSVIAWRILWLTHINRLDPESPCDTVLSDNEWKTLFCRIHKTNKLPNIMPTVGDVIIWIARLGGFLARKSDGMPGPTVIWRGWTTLYNLTMMRDILITT